MVVQKKDFQHKVFTYGLTLGQKLKNFSKEKYSTEGKKKKKKEVGGHVFLIESKGEFSNIQMEQDNKEGWETIHFLNKMKSQMLA